MYPGLETVISEHYIRLFQTLFAGRSDVFAVRWEKNGKSGYMPSYQFDKYALQKHKISGGTFQTFSDKQFKPLTDLEVERHLVGQQHIGIYPLLVDNTSCFIVADFDKENWVEESRAFAAMCKRHGLQAHLERSRSGNGGHVWIFFESPYPAYKSRRLFLSLLKESGAVSVFEKESSFDRLFPNQDTHSGKGLGNLIALPLFQQAVASGNSCFVDPETLVPFENQWEYLRQIKKTEIAAIEKAYSEILSEKFLTTAQEPSTSLTISLSNSISLNRSGIPLVLINFLKEELNFANSEFLVKKKLGKSPFGIEHYFRFVEERNNEVVIPRGMIGKLMRFCNEHQIEFQFNDLRAKVSLVDFKPQIRLRPYQTEAAATVMKKDFGVIVAPPGSGKTIVALHILAERKQPALVIVHRKQLADQWMDRIETFLGIPRREIGLISGGKIRIGKLLTVATIQTLNKIATSNEITKIENAFGSIVVDECHHIPAQTYRNTVSRLRTFYLYGLTATPFRKYNDGKLIFVHLGEVVAEIRQQSIADHPKARVIVRNTNLFVPFNIKTDKLETLSKVLVHDSTRNRLILDDVAAEVNNGRRGVIITERKDHIESLNQFLKQSFETIVLSGDDSESSKKEKWDLLHQGEFQVLITTGQYFGEGSDLAHVNCVFLAYPFSFEGKLVQYIGRVQRSEIPPIVYDYRDNRIKYLETQFQQRNLYYRRLYSEGMLFEQTVGNELSTDVEETIKVPFVQLQFRHSAIAFRHRIERMKVELEFEVENKAMRPEFEVLKPYFSRVIRSKHVRIDLVARFKNGEPLSQVAFSSDLDRISRQVIDSVKFTFVNKNILGRQHKEGDDLLKLEDLQTNETLFNSEAELLDHVLKQEDLKHFHQLQYLAERHLKTILKLRFVLMPFSFVFLVGGENNYHVVWETLDTEEATFIWHVGKDKIALREKLRLINKDLGFIRNKGRHTFIETNPANFSRLVHDYTDVEKGFVIWKDKFEERLS